MVISRVSDRMIVFQVLIHIIIISAVLVYAPSMI